MSSSTVEHLLSGLWVHLQCETDQLWRAAKRTSCTAVKWLGDKGAEVVQKVRNATLASATSNCCIHDRLAEMKRVGGDACGEGMIEQKVTDAPCCVPPIFSHGLISLFSVQFSTC